MCLKKEESHDLVLPPPSDKCDGTESQMCSRTVKLTHCYC